MQATITASVCGYLSQAKWYGILFYNPNYLNNFIPHHLNNINQLHKFEFNNTVHAATFVSETTVVAFSEDHTYGVWDVTSGGLYITLLYLQYL